MLDILALFFLIFTDFTTASYGPLNIRENPRITSINVRSSIFNLYVDWLNDNDIHTVSIPPL